LTDLQRNRRLSAIVMADVVGYSLMMNEDEIATLEVIKDIQTDLINPLVSRHGGSIVKTMGDGFLIEFALVVEATQCSIKIQKSVFQLNGEDQSKGS
jgi:adenylate cyclase